MPPRTHTHSHESWITFTHSYTARPRRRRSGGKWCYNYILFTSVPTTTPSNYPKVSSDNRFCIMLRKFHLTGTKDPFLAMPELMFPPFSNGAIRRKSIHQARPHPTKGSAMPLPVSGSTCHDSAEETGGRSLSPSTVVEWQAMALETAK